MIGIGLEVCLPLNFAVCFDFMYYRFGPNKAKLRGNVLKKRQTASLRSMFFFLLYNVHCLLNPNHSALLNRMYATFPTPLGSHYRLPLRMTIK
jgi:hypothetical protein